MISGLVVYLCNDDTLAQATIDAIQQQPAIELGRSEDLRQPLVLETDSAGESQELTDWMKDLPGVEHVDVAFVHLDENSETNEVPQQESLKPPLHTTRN